jgi:endoglucanase
MVLRVVFVWGLASSTSLASTAPEWPDWKNFSDRFVQADGRVIDITFDRKSTSEGQSYGLFFALVANQRAQFDTLLKWTSDNLAHGQLGQKLPGWLWGLHEDGRWGLKDENSAADADLWIAYTLLEAGRLWQTPKYTVMGLQLLALIERHEIAQAGPAGPVLLPAPIGFKLEHGRLRINPSYLPGFMFRYLATTDPQGPWQAVWDGYMRMSPKIFSAGVAPDLFIVDSAGVVTPDSERNPSGSYDAIRVYLWAGMSGSSSQGMLKRLTPYADLIRQFGAPPEKINPLSGLAIKSDYSPIGYSGAVLPFLSAIDDQSSLEKQRQRLHQAAVKASKDEATNYYDQVLILFGKGWLDGQYRFDEQGRLQPKWAHASIH